MPNTLRELPQTLGALRLSKFSEDRIAARLSYERFRSAAGIGIDLDDGHTSALASKNPRGGARVV